MFISLPYSLLISSLVLGGAARQAESATTEIELRELTASDFSTSTEEGVWFVEYFTPWCGHCRNFAPTWKRLVEHVESQGIGIHLAQVDCVAQGDLCHDNDIKSYPTMKLYKDGKELETFKDSREWDILAKYVADHASTSSESDSSATPSPNPDGAVLPLDGVTFRDTIAEGPAFVNFFAPWCGHCKKLAPIWIQFAARMKDKVRVAEVDCAQYPSVCSEEKIWGYPTIILYQHGHAVDYPNQRTLEGLEAFAEEKLALSSKSESTPVVDEQGVPYLVVHEGSNLGPQAHLGT